MDFNRYKTQLRLEEIGSKGQNKLFSSTVLIVGCGALGSLTAMYLAAAGTGKIILADFDNIDISNLHRQVFYDETEIGLPKVDILSKKISLLNSDIEIESWKKLVNNKILEEHQDDFNVIIDAADNPETTYMLEDFCFKYKLPFVTAGIREWEAQIYTWRPGFLKFSEIFPQSVSNSSFLPCSLQGVIGPVAGLAASIQVSEALKIMLGLEVTNTLITIDLLSNKFSKFNV